MRTVVIFILIFFGTSKSSFSQTKVDSVAHKYYEQGKKAYGNDDYFTATNIFNKAINRWDSLSNKNEKDSIYYARTLQNRANCHLELEYSLQDALKDAKTTLEIKSKYYSSDNPHELIPHYSYGLTLTAIARILGKMGDYDNAIKHYEEAIIYCKKNKNNSKIARNYSDIGILYNDQKHPDTAIKTLNKALEIIPRDERNGQIHGNIYENLGIAYDEKNQLDTALYFYRKALKIYEYIESDKGITNLNGNIPVTLKKQGNYDEAHDFLDKSFEDYKKQYKEKYHPEYAAYFNNKGDIFNEQNNTRSALLYHHLALVHHLNDFQNEIPTSTPPDSLLSKNSNKPDLLIYLASKAETAALISNRKLALDTYKAYDYTVGIMRREHASDQTKLHWIAGVRPVYELAIQVAKVDSMELAFHFTEKSRAVLLMDRLRDLDAKAFAIPDTLLQKERELRSRLASEEGDKEKENINSQIDILIKKFEKEYPNYYALKYDLSTSSIDSIQQNLLDKNTTLIEYFYGDSMIYAFFISNDDINIQAISRDSIFDAHLTNFKRYVLSDSNDSCDNDILYHSAYQLYQSFLAHYLNDKNEHRLIIIPDGALYSIPFEALFTEALSDRDNPPFLIEKHITNYGYSVQALLQSHKSSQKPNKRFLGIAPLTYTYNDANGKSLDTLDEGNTLIQSMQGCNDAMLLDTAATIKNFKNMAPDYRIIHFHTHGFATSNQEPSIAFKNTVMHLPELYNIDFQADMVVIAACKTGLGEHRKGEGVISFARGFAYQGVPSIVMTLSNVGQDHTAFVMKYFYDNLQEGQDKVEALHHAKREYIKENHIEPYKWASIIHIGDTEPVFDAPCYCYLYLLLLFIGMVATYYIAKRKNT